MVKSIALPSPNLVTERGVYAYGHSVPFLPGYTIPYMPGKIEYMQINKFYE